MKYCSFIPINTSFDLQPSGIAENLSDMRLDQLEAYLPELSFLSKNLPRDFSTTITNFSVYKEDLYNKDYEVSRNDTHTGFSSTAEV